MKKISRLFGYILFTVFTSHAFAENHNYTLRICTIQSANHVNNAYIRVCKTDPYPNGWKSKNGCASDNYIGWDLSEFQGKLMYATALTAFALDKQIQIRLDPTWKTCIGTDEFNFDHIQMIRMIK